MSSNVNLSDYNIILLSNILEHITNPKYFLIQLYNKIDSKETKVIFDVPNLDGIFRYSNKPVDFFHISHKIFINNILYIIY